jgi:signal peptidase I
MKEFIKKHPTLMELTVKIVVFLSMLFIIFGFVIGVTTQDSDSMAPNIKFHDVVLYSKINTDYTIRDVVVYKYEGELYIGRLVGTPNNSIYVSQSGSVFQNNYLVSETNIYSTDNSEVDYKVDLGENQYYVLCDNREYHTDSRDFGPIDRSQIVGVVILDVRRFGL